MEKFFWVLMESQEKSVISALEKAKRIGATVEMRAVWISGLLQREL